MQQPINVLQQHPWLSLLLGLKGQCLTGSDHIQFAQVYDVPLNHGDPQGSVLAPILFTSTFFL